jgi:nitroreductase
VTATDDYYRGQVDRLHPTTRTVRRRMDLACPVARDVVLDCVRLATQAPSGGNSQRWHWVLVDDRPLIAEVARLYRSAYQAHIAAKTAALTAQVSPAIIASSDHLADHLHEVPVLAIPCLTGRLAACPSTAECSEFYGSILPAAWSFMLALRSRGLVSAFTTVHLRHEAAVGALLEIPADVTQIALIPVAYPTGTSFRPGQRKPVNEVSSWNGWPAQDLPGR